MTAPRWPYDATDRVQELIGQLGAKELECHRLRDVVLRLIVGIGHLSEIARQWEPDHSSGADRRRWLLAKDARDDAARLLNLGGSMAPGRQSVNDH